MALRPRLARSRIALERLGVERVRRDWPLSFEPRNPSADWRHRTLERPKGRADSVFALLALRCATINSWVARASWRLLP